MVCESRVRRMGFKQGYPYGYAVQVSSKATANQHTVSGLRVRTRTTFGTCAEARSVDLQPLYPNRNGPVTE